MESKNFWTQTSTKKLLQVERTLLGLAGIDDYKLDYASLDGPEGQLKMHYLEIGKQRAPKMILIHGFGGGCLMLFRIFKDLAKHFHLISIDMLGMGGSSRPKWIAKNPIEGEAFFVESLELFRIAVNWESFILMGHSFGGFVSGKYAATYPHRVNHLILLSPAGIAQKEERKGGQDALDIRFSGTWKGRVALKFLRYFWKNNVTPFQVARSFGVMSSGLFKRYVEGRFNDLSLSREERFFLTKYLYQVNMQSGSGEKGFTTCFNPDMQAHYPLRSRLRHSKFSNPITLVYGYEDWMDPTHAYLLQGELEAKGIQCHIKLIEKGGHHMYIDNPQGCIDAILQDVLGLKEKKEGIIDDRQDLELDSLRVVN